MGIKDLLKTIGSDAEGVTAETCLVDLLKTGHTFVTDGNSWLHFYKAVDILGLFKDDMSKILADKIVALAKRWQQEGLEVTFIFDGSALPAKRVTQDDRSKARAVATATTVTAANTLVGVATQ